MNNKYGDIIHLPNHRSLKHPPMSPKDRAAQFSPFAALSGYEEAIKETARLTHQKPHLTEELKANLNAKLLLLEKNLDSKPEIAITFFVSDKRKPGGTYITEKGQIRKIDPYKGTVIMQNKVTIPLGDITSIEGDIFEKNTDEFI